MNFLVSVASPILFILKRYVRWSELRKYKEALRRNPHDHVLRARYAKLCLDSYFQDSSSKTHIVEAVNQFENIVHSEVMDLEMFYLMGKYYQGKDDKKAIEVYRDGIKRFNDHMAKTPGFRHEQIETAFSLALSLLALESNNADPELEKFFKIIRRTYLKNFLDQKADLNPEILVEKSKGDSLFFH